MLYGDNQSTLDLIRNHKINDLTKHVSITYHFLRNLVLERKCFDLQNAPSSENLMDICTKGLAKPQYDKLRNLTMQHEEMVNEIAR